MFSSDRIKPPPPPFCPAIAGQKTTLRRHDVAKTGTPPTESYIVKPLRELSAMIASSSRPIRCVGPTRAASVAEVVKPLAARPIGKAKKRPLPRTASSIAHGNPVF
jgi:hypothetical protein